MQLSKSSTYVLLLIYYLSYILEFLIIYLVIAFILLAFFFLINKNFSIFNLFLVILPSIYGLNLNNHNFSFGIYYFTFIDPILLASIFCLLRNILMIKKINYKLFFILYLIILVSIFFQLILLEKSNIINNQGFSFSLKALLYFNAIFFINQSNVQSLKDELNKIINLSVIIFALNIFSGFYYYLISGFINIYLKFNKSIVSILIFIWCSYLVLVNLEATTSILIYVLSLLIFINFHKIFLKNSFVVFIIVNFSLILYFIFLFYHTQFTDYINNNFDLIKETKNIFIVKILLDRSVLFLGSLDQSNLIWANFDNINLDGYKNIISSEDKWSYGSHNYFLDLNFKIGTISSFIIFLIINIFIFRILKLVNILKIESAIQNYFKIFFFILILVYGIWGLIGNSFGEGIGFFFFMLIGSIHSCLDRKARVSF